MAPIKRQVKHTRTSHHRSGQQQHSGPSSLTTTAQDDARTRSAMHLLQRGGDASVFYAGLSIPVHPVWPDLPQGQGELFFECTLFLYSVLALFLQYLNLYKTLWWLPNSHWHHSVKYHLVDPHLLSCVGLLLGLRVTRCFWNTITEFIQPGPGEKPSSYMWFLEYCMIKAPMTCAVMSSFLFSFIRVVRTYPLNTLFYLVYPFVVYNFLFYNEISAKMGFPTALTSTGQPKPHSVVDPDSVAHVCTENPAHIREEADCLIMDLFLRVKHCLFAAYSTSYLAVYIPCVFTPGSFCCSKSTVVLLKRWSEADQIYPDSSVVKHGRLLYRARGGPVAAEPGNSDHNRFYKMAGEPLTLINGMCVFQGMLIVVQFLMLVHSTDWQHIVTLVLLMFANYLLLAKVFKDKVIIGRIYYPSPEDEALVQAFLAGNIHTFNE